MFTLFIAKYSRNVFVSIYVHKLLSFLLFYACLGVFLSYPKSYTVDNILRSDFANMSFTFPF